MRHHEFLVSAIVTSMLLLASSCGSVDEANDLTAPPTDRIDSGTDSTSDTSPDAVTDSEQPDVTFDTSTDDVMPDVPEDPPADPFLPPDVEVSTWKGKLPPGGFFDLGIQVVYPTAPPLEQLPLVVFAHGFQIDEGWYAATQAHLAKFGYVVASVDYDGSLIDQDHHAPVDAMVKAMDMLTTSPPPEIGNIVDPQRIVAAGHSLGGKGAIWTSIEDARVRAVVALDAVDDDPSPFPNPSAKRPSLAPEEMGGVQVPVLFLGAQLSPTGNQPCAPLASNVCRFHESMPAGVPSWIAVVERFGHMQFIDDYGCIVVCGTCERGPEAEHMGQQVVFRGLTVAFLEYVMRGKTGYLPLLEGPWLGALQTDNQVLDPTELDMFCASPI